MNNFADRLFAAVDRKGSCVVVGLDPRVEALPPDLRERAAESLEAAAEAVLEFNRGVLDAVTPHVVAAKVQSAFYEALGWPGVRCYQQTIRAARERGLLTIADVKRGDIGSTAEAYARAHLDHFGADAVTLNPYLGSDAIAPFLDRTSRGKGIFVLVRTSNPSSAELQDLDAEGVPLHERVAALVREWGSARRGRQGYSAVGAVVAATYPAVAARLRELMPGVPFLVPGYGAQGATAEDCRPCFDGRGRGAVVNSSRGIIFAYAREAGRPGAWQEAVERAARRMKESLEAVRAGGGRVRPDGSD